MPFSFVARATASSLIPNRLILEVHRVNLSLFVCQQTTQELIHVFSGLLRHSRRIISVLIEDSGTFDVIGDVNRKFTVYLKFAETHVSGVRITQAQRVVGINNGPRYRVWVINGQVRVVPCPQ